MGVFEDTIVKAKDVVDTAAKKSGDFISLQKLKIEASKLSSLISKDYETLGRVVFENLKSGVAAEDGTDETIAQLRRHRAQLCELEKQISENKGTVLCTECGYANPSDCTFCGKCGNRL